MRGPDGDKGESGKAGFDGAPGRIGPAGVPGLQGAPGNARKLLSLHQSLQVVRILLCYTVIMVFDFYTVVCLSSQVHLEPKEFQVCAV